jgi:DNA-binding transcriptional ArsR family regulator
VDVFAALADPVRRDLLSAVASGPVRVVDLAATQSISRPAVSRHLRVLTEAGLLEVEQQGRERHYALLAEPLRPVREYLDRLHALGSRLTTGALDALDTEVRRTSRDRRNSTGRSRVRPTPGPGTQSKPTKEAIA